MAQLSTTISHDHNATALHFLISNLASRSAFAGSTSISAFLSSGYWNRNDIEEKGAMNVLRMGVREVGRYWNGVKGVYAQWEVYRKYRAVGIAGIPSRNELILYRTYCKDFPKLVPFTILTIAPFGSYLILLLLPYFPTFAPSAFRTIEDQYIVRQSLISSQKALLPILKPSFPLPYHLPVKDINLLAQFYQFDAVSQQIGATGVLGDHVKYLEREWTLTDISTLSDEEVMDMCMLRGYIPSDNRDHNIALLHHWKDHYHPSHHPLTNLSIPFSSFH